EINLKKRTNQSFVQVPFAKFRQVLKTVGARYGIRVILQEESYTSKACFGNRDYIPTYGAGDTENMAFSGKRIKRGLYRQDDGKVMNADINGAANTGRKYDSRIFPEDMDCSYLYRTVRAVTYKDILGASQDYHKSNPGETGQRASVCPVTA
ncbi:MAG: transposase, partial [Oscillospiraceae bacterium]|nr:transposase [Oscillospiraceae bacterium]